MCGLEADYVWTSRSHKKYIWKSRLIAYAVYATLTWIDGEDAVGVAMSVLGEEGALGLTCGGA